MFLSLLFMISIAGASPEFSIVDEGAPSPIEGVVFNPEALSEVLTAPQRAKEECEIEWTRTLEKKESDFTFELEKEVITQWILFLKVAVVLVFFFFLL